MRVDAGKAESLGRRSDNDNGMMGDSGAVEKVSVLSKKASQADSTCLKSLENREVHRLGNLAPRLFQQPHCPLLLLLLLFVPIFHFPKRFSGKKSTDYCLNDFGEPRQYERSNHPARQSDGYGVNPFPRPFNTRLTCSQA